MSVSVAPALTIMSSPPLPARVSPRPSAFSPPMSPSTPDRSLLLNSSPTLSSTKSLKRHRPEPLAQPLPVASLAPLSAGSLPSAYSSSSASIFALSDMHSPTRPVSAKRSKPSSLNSPSSVASSPSDRSPVSPLSTSPPVSPSSNSSVTGFASFLPHPPTTSTTSTATSPTSPHPPAASLPPLLTFSIPNRTSWFSLHSVDAIEKRALGEFFTKRNPPPTASQAHTRTPLALVHQRPVPLDQPSHAVSIVPPPSLSTGVGASAYMRYRNTLLLASALRPDAYLTGTEARKLLGGVNAASVLRIHAFLDSWGLINQHTPAGRRAATGSGEDSAVNYGQTEETSSVASSVGRARRRVTVKRESTLSDSMEGFVDRTFEVMEEMSALHDLSLPVAAVGIAV